MRLAREEKKGRFVALVTVFVCLFLVFALRLINIQVINGDKYSKTSTASTSSTIVKATRGQILDRNGNVLFEFRLVAQHKIHHQRQPDDTQP